MCPVSPTMTIFPPLGALPNGDGTTTFRVWAPNVRSVAVAARGVRTDLPPVGGGVFEGVAAAGAGDDYLFVLDRRERWPDPCSRAQPGGLTGPSRIVDPATLRRGGRAPVAL